jgi:hypothetical protein
MVKKKQVLKEEQKIPDYDSAWKEVIEKHFELFLKFFFPDIHQDIDFSKKPEILSKELRKIATDSKVGKRYSDVLMKVYFKDGSTKSFCIFIHVEVQGTRDSHFMERIFVYFYRIFDKYREEGSEVISVAILTDEDVNYRPNEYYFSRGGFELRLKIPIVKIIDFKNKEESRVKLETSTNPMALIVKAQLKSLEAKKGDDARKYNIKFALIRELYKQGYDKEGIRSFFDFIDLIIRLPDDLEVKLFDEIIKIEEDHKMPHLATWERTAEKRGEIRGEKRGEKRGEQRGEIKVKLETARRMLNDDMPIDRIIKYTGLTEEEIKGLIN